jgi:cytochrome P450
VKHLIEYDPLDLATIVNPYPVYAALRTHSPVYWHEGMYSWVLTRYQDCRNVLRNSELFARDRRRIGAYLSDDRLSIQTQDPPQQVELRHLISNSIKAQNLKGICRRARSNLKSLITQRTRGCPFNFMTEIASPIALQITCELVGVENLKATVYHPIFEGITRQMDGRIDISRIEDGEQMRTILSKLMKSWFSTRRDSGMITHLQDSLMNNPMPDAYVQNTMSAVFNASYSTLYAITGDVLLLLLIQRPDILSILRSNPLLMKTAIDEIIRFISPAQGTSRYATRETHIGDTRIAENECVITLFAAANRDPDQFANPDELVLDRSPNPHLGFGWGSHVCIGAPVATSWIYELIEFLCTQQPNFLELAGDPLYMHAATLRNLSHLPVQMSHTLGS